MFYCSNRKAINSLYFCIHFPHGNFSATIGGVSSVVAQVVYVAILTVYGPEDLVFLKEFIEILVSPHVLIFNV